LADFCTIPANIGGFPALSLNAGFSEGLPVGFQLIANSFDEETLFSAALGLEEMLPKTPFPPIT
jgi:aspartyl-tRNA(Asn)/glutamyl-tRNA(Gln) amidotransferase subunit A